MNVNALLDFQKELLKPFAPSQDFALATLILPEVDEETVIDFCSEIQFHFPFVSDMYAKYVFLRPENAIPLIVPVYNKEKATDEIFELHTNVVTVGDKEVQESKVMLSSTFTNMLSDCMAKIPPHVSTPDELFFGSPDTYMRLTLEEIHVGLMQGFFLGAMPVTVKKDSFWNKLLCNEEPTHEEKYFDMNLFKHNNTGRLTDIRQST